MKRRDRVSAWAAGGLFAVLYPLGMPGYDVPGLPFVAMAPLIAFSLSARDARRAALRGFAAGTAASLPLFYWIAYTVAVPGKLGWAAGGLATVLVSLYLGLYPAAAAFALHRLENRLGAGGIWLFPFVWVGLEYVRSIVLSGFPWMLMGYGLSGRPALMQAADLAGVYGLGFLLALSGVCLYETGRRLVSGERRRALLPLAGFAAVPLLLYAYGTFRLGQPDARPPGPGLRIGVAQGGIDQGRKWDPAYQRRTLEIYDALSREARAAGADVVVWPETAAPFFYGWEAELTREVDRIATSGGVPMIFGTVWYSPSEGGKYYNSVFLVDGKGVPAGRYDKRHLVPFGEYIPLRTVLFFLRKLTEGGEDFSAGSGPALFPVRGTLAGASVCYEAVFPPILGEGVRDGAHWLVNVTNDAWFGDTVAPHQHLAMARMRTVEFRRPMVRAANAGISALIDAKGGIVARLGLFRQGTVVGEIVPGRGETFYAKTGDLFGISCTIITFSSLLYLMRGTNGVRTARRKIRRTRVPLSRTPGLPLK